MIGVQVGTRVTGLDTTVNLTGRAERKCEMMAVDGVVVGGNCLTRKARGVSVLNPCMSLTLLEISKLVV